MATSKRAARTIAVLLMLQMVCGPLVNFGLLRPMAGTSFLANAAAQSPQIGLAVVIGLAMVAMSLGIAIVAFPVFRQYSQAMALWLLALAGVGFAVAVVEYIHVLSMLSLSQAYAKTGAADPAQFQTLGVAVAATRRWAHYMGLIFGGSVAFVLYGALYRFALVPRVLAAFGAIAALLEIIAVALPLFGHGIVFPMIAPLGLAHLALVFWLLTKGFAERQLSALNLRE